MRHLKPVSALLLCLATSLNASRHPEQQRTIDIPSVLRLWNLNSSREDVESRDICRLVGAPKRGHRRVRPIHALLMLPGLNRHHRKRIISDVQQCNFTVGHNKYLTKITMREIGRGQESVRRYETSPGAALFSIIRQGSFCGRNGAFCGYGLIANEGPVQRELIQLSLHLIHNFYQKNCDRRWSGVVTALLPRRKAESEAPLLEIGFEETDGDGLQNHRRFELPPGTFTQINEETLEQQWQEEQREQEESFQQQVHAIEWWLEQQQLAAWQQQQLQQQQETLVQPWQTYQRDEEFLQQWKAHLAQQQEHELQNSEENDSQQ